MRMADANTPCISKVYWYSYRISKHLEEVDLQEDVREKVSRKVVSDLQQKESGLLGQRHGQRWGRQ
jgi:hypothetical protein